MEISLEKKTVRLSVGEFAAYREGPALAGAGGSFADIKRAQLGTHWHGVLRNETAAAHPQALFEKTIERAWIYKGWTFEFQGRVDQLVPQQDGGFLVREIKTVSTPLPRSADSLREHHPDFFFQLAAYCVLLSLDADFKNAKLTGELLCLDIHSQVRQRFHPEQPPELLFTRQLDLLLVFLEDRLHARARLRSVDFHNAFAQLRPGQAQAQAELDEALNRSKNICFEAPTGFGKTGLLLQAALKRLRDGRFSWLIYLTGKSTGQLAVVRQLAPMAKTGALRSYQMRNRLEHAIRSKTHTCTQGARCDCEDAAERWQRANLRMPELFKDGTIPLARVKKIAETHGLCPYEISRAALPYADVWLCDYNYIFAPSSRSFLANQFGFSPRDTLLVIDEAHNLPERVADAYSLKITAQTLGAIGDILTLARAPLGAKTAAENLLKFVNATAQTPQLELSQLYELEHLIETLDTHIAETIARMDIDELLSQRADLWEHLYASANWLDFLRNEDISKLVWSEKPAQISLTCLDASREIAKTTAPFGAVVYASATLSPGAQFAHSVGLDEKNTAWIRAQASWHEGAFNFAIDARPDTRLNQRARYHELTAQAICDLAADSPAPVAVFFSSYQYAHDVGQYVHVKNPFLRVATQPRGLDLPGQNTFLQESLLTSHVLFLVLGSGFSESIDSLGGKINRAMVVGPALPELNAVQRAKERELKNTHEDSEAFRRVYQLPAMRKINQALGRLVRAPGHKAAIVLHCRRFDEKVYRDLLNLPTGEISLIKTNEQWADWLEKIREF